MARSRVLAVLACLGLMVLASPFALAQVTFRDGCTTLYSSGFAPVSSTTSLQVDTGSPFVTTLMTQVALDYPAIADTVVSGCYYQTQWTLINNVNLPPIDTALALEAIWTSLNHHQPSWTPNSQQNTTTGKPYHYTPTAASGVRGAIDVPTTNLVEGSPAWLMVIEDTTQPINYVPFVVTDPGDGDTLSVYNSNGLIFNQPLGNFAVGELYFVPIPAPANSFPYDLLTIYLNSTGARNASVAIGTGWDITYDPITSMSLVESASASTFSTAATSVTYTYQITNTGTVALSGISIADTLPGLSAVSCPSGTLDPEASESCTATYTTTQADVDNGTLKSSAMASATGPNGAVTTPSSLLIAATQIPAIALVKTANVANYAAPGTRIAFAYQVTNSGNVDLNPVTVSDPMAGLSAVSCPTGALAPAATMTCTSTYLTTQADVDGGAITNTATAAGTILGGATVIATATLTTPASDAPAISIVKAASTASFSASGVPFTYTYRVSNTGNVDLNPVSVSDPLPGLSSIACTGVALAPNASLMCSATYTTSAADVSNGAVASTATATGNAQTGAVASATSTLSIPFQVPQNFAIAASTASITLPQGGTGTLTVTSSVSGGFNGAVALSASGLPTGVSASFNPASVPVPGSGSSVITLITGASAAPGTYAITLAGTGGALARSTTVTLIITAAAATGGHLTVAPATISFGKVPWLNIRYQTVTVTNTGTSAVSIRNVGLNVQTGKGLLVPVSFCPSLLAQGKSCSIHVGLLTTDTAHEAAALVISDNAIGSPQTIPITVN